MKAPKKQSSHPYSSNNNKDKHQKLDEEDQNSQAHSQREMQSELPLPQKINRDEIIEKLSQDMKKFTEERK